MKLRDVELAVAETGQAEGVVCGALRIVLPILRVLALGTSWWKRWIASQLVSALEDWQRDRCVSVPTPKPTA